MSSQPWSLVGASLNIAIKTKAGETLRLPTTHNIAGGTFRLGGTDEAWLNVTYNYYRFFVRALGKNGIRTIYWLTPRESIPILDAAIVTSHRRLLRAYEVACRGAIRSSTAS